MGKVKIFLFFLVLWVAIVLGCTVANAQVSVTLESVSVVTDSLTTVHKAERMGLEVYTPPFGEYPALYLNNRTGGGTFLVNRDNTLFMVDGCPVRVPSIAASRIKVAYRRSREGVGDAK